MKAIRRGLAPAGDISAVLEALFERGVPVNCGTDEKVLDFSGAMRNCVIERRMQQIDVTCFGDTAKMAASGIVRTTIRGSMYANDEVMRAMVCGERTRFTHIVGNQHVTGEMLITHLQLSAGMNEAIAVEFEAEVLELKAVQVFEDDIAKMEKRPRRAMALSGAAS